MKAAGYTLQSGDPSQPKSGDVLVIWNRYGPRHDLATSFEARGGTVIVAENGYLDPGRDTARSWYAMAVGGHNGQGQWMDGGPSRWARIAPRLGVTLAPWRAEGEHILVCPNRSFGRPGFIMPSDWAQRTAEQLGKITDRPVRVRSHPGNDAPKVPLSADLAGCWAMVIWASSAGVKALAAGIPVFSLAPAWILKSAAESNLRYIDRPLTDTTETRLRGAGFERLAWAQWHVDEIASGEAFGHLLPTTGEA